MIHHAEIVSTPRRVTVIPAVPSTERPPVALRVVQAAAVLLIALFLTAFSLQAQAAAATQAGSDSAAAPVRSVNWLSDRRTLGVGDMVRVLIDEYAMAEASKDNANAASRRRQMSVDVSPPSLPGSTSAMGPVAGSVATGDAGESRQQGTASRDTRYVGEVMARITEVTPEGLLRITGTKTIDVDKNQAVLTLSGLIRPIDVASRDVIRSEQIADAQLSYKAKGSLGKPKNGIISKLLGLFWP